MKTMMSYISLLLLSGLILVFYNAGAFKGVSRKHEQPKVLISGSARSGNLSLIKDIAGGLFPVLKDLD